MSPNKLRLLLKPRTAIPLLLFFVLLLFAGFLAITQEPPDDDSFDTDFQDEDFELGFFSDEEFDEDEESYVWMPPGPPRWFKSNAGGMTLEEIPSRIVALRNEYALVIDYLAPEEVEPFLQPFFMRDYTIEIRVLYKEGEEHRRQWLFSDEAGITRLNAVFRPRQTDDQAVSETSPVAPEPEAGEDESVETATAESTPWGFIEIFNENTQIIGDYLFLEDGEEMLTSYFYNEGFIVRAEAERRLPGEEYRKVHTDVYRYNRSFSLRHVERLYHDAATVDPVRLVFPYRVLDAAADTNFISENLALGSDFFGSFAVAEGFRMVYDTDPRGRILSQTLLDSGGEVVWVITNTWVGERITVIKKVEGGDQWLTEYVYDSGGKRVEQRDTRNGMLERLVRINGDRETEELYMNGTLVMRAFWEDGRKISEERVRAPAQVRR